MDKVRELVLAARHHDGMKKIQMINGSPSLREGYGD
jgi:hypothetical protein